MDSLYKNSSAPKTAHENNATWTPKTELHSKISTIELESTMKFQTDFNCAKRLQL